ncbi:hypothetical protein V6R21_23165 [Limibacter armeniacum]|uniref:hypothetical protein n=1 Tax=Limibacter armeniacum TaxID=466084 RepID=UPI002FE55093
MKLLSTYLLLIGLLTAVSFQGFTQQHATQKDEIYYVVHVSGDITSLKDDRKVVPGMELQSSEKLKFVGVGAKAVVLSRKGGRMLLQAPEGKEKATEFELMVNEVFVPKKVHLRMSTRQAPNSLVNNLKDYFGEERFAIIGNELTVKLDSFSYPLNEEKVMVLYYKQPEGAEKNIQIPYETDNSLVFHKDSLYNDMDPGYTTGNSIYYFYKPQKEARKLAEFQPVFIEENKLLEELKLMHDFLSEKKLAEGSLLYEEMLSFVTDVYGKVDLNLFDQWTKKHGLYTGDE